MYGVGQQSELCSRFLFYMYVVIELICALCYTFSHEALYPQAYRQEVIKRTPGGSGMNSDLHALFSSLAEGGDDDDDAAGASSSAPSKYYLIVLQMALFDVSSYSLCQHNKFAYPSIHFISPY